MELNPTPSKFKLMQSELFQSKFSSLVPEGIKQTFEQHDDFLVQREDLMTKTAQIRDQKQLAPQIIMTPEETPMLKAMLDAKSEIITTEKMPQQKSTFNLLR